MTCENRGGVCNNVNYQCGNENSDPLRNVEEQYSNGNNWKDELKSDCIFQLHPMFNEILEIIGSLE